VLIEFRFAIRMGATLEKDGQLIGNRFSGGTDTGPLEPV